LRNFLEGNMKLEKREILFRAWHKEWGMSMVFSLGSYPTWTRKLEVPGQPEKAEYFDDQYFEWSVDPDCIKLQYTGLKDYEGKRIFEGDIVIAEYFEDYEVSRTGIVNYHAGSFYLKDFADKAIRAANDGNGEWYSLVEICCNDQLTKIGDIFSNPELLKQNAN